MPVDATWRVQSNSGLVTGTTTGFTATLPNPTMPGATLLLFIGASGSGGTITPQAQSFDPPFVQDQAQAANWYAWRRPDQPAGETSWAISQQTAIAANFYWRAEEWSGLTSAGQPDASGSITSAAGSLTAATDQTSSCTADVADFAALAVFRVSTTNNAAGFPAGHSYGAGASAGPSSWNEVAYLVNGTGAGSTDFILAIAEAYPGASGNVGCTLTLSTSGGGATPQGIDAWAVCYQPSAAAPPGGILTAL